MRRLTPLLVFFADALLVQFALAAPRLPKELSAEVIQRHQTQLLAGVDAIIAPGIPGPLCVYGPRAFPVVVDTQRDRAVVTVAAAEFEQGRLVAFGHNGYLGDAWKQHEGTGILFKNCVTWAAGTTSPKLQGLKVAVRGYALLGEWLQAAGAVVKPVSGNDWLKQAAGAQVIIAELHDATPAEQKTLAQFVKTGGGVVSAGLIWGWQQLNPDSNPHVDHGGNRLFGQAGLVWSDGYADTSSGETLILSPPSPLTHAGHALRAVIAEQTELAMAEGRIVAATLERLAAIPADLDLGVLTTANAFIEQHAAQIPIPTAQQPVRATQPRERALVSLHTRHALQQPPSKLTPHPAAANFPGAVESDAPRTQSLKRQVDGTQWGWKSLGLYAPPGEVVTVVVKQASANLGWHLQVGSHADRVWHLADWQRTPELIRRFPIDKPRTHIGSAHGGLIYLDLPEKSAGGTITLEVTGAVLAPLYVLGETTAEQWDNEQRLAPGPWAELATPNIILTVPSSLIRELDEPQPLMEHWQQAVDLCADLSTMPHKRARPERLVFDRQISAGFMHSGYPIMALVDPSAPEAVSLRHLQQQGGWGFYHELGHNHQQPEWTFEGTVEVTCNLYSLFVHEMLTPRAYTHDMVQPAQRQKLERDYIAAGANFAQWKKDPFLALVMYQQLRDAFGWEAYQRVFAEYRQLPASERPQTDSEKHDQWLVRFSRTVKRDLAPFFKHWGIPMSDAAQRTTAAWPAWPSP